MAGNRDQTRRVYRGNDPQLILRAPNRNAARAAIIIEEFYRLGVRHVWASPGSRSGPMVLAAAQHPGLALHMHLDERGSSFAALGAGRTGVPALVLTTSGTAAANLYPAVIEASMDHVPLILLTADRPLEMRHSGANQTIDQVKMFGDRVRFYAELPAPDDPADSRSVLGLIDQSFARATGADAGPVHLNLPFREPLAPTAEAYDAPAFLKPLTEWLHTDDPMTRVHDPIDAIVDMTRLINESRRGLIVAGALSCRADQEAILALSRRTGWPVIADILSGLRSRRSNTLVTAADRMLRSSSASALNPDLVLQFGGRLVSKRIPQWIASLDDVIRIRIHRSTDRLDPESAFQHRVRSTAASFVPLLKVRQRRVPSAWSREWTRLQRKCIARGPSPTQLGEPSIAKLVAGASFDQLFLASSMPVRDADLFASQSPAHVYASRGASGIDGTIASAVGIARATGESMVVHIGDLALLHDLNSLLLLRDCRSSFTIVCVNNDGGGIFNLLPFASHTQHFEACFATPHGLRFKQAAALFGVHYERPQSVSSLRKALISARARSGASLIEVVTDRKANAVLHRNLLELRPTQA